MISSSIHTIFNINKKIIDYVIEEGIDHVEEEYESVSQKDIAKVEAELIAELEELYE